MKLKQKPGEETVYKFKVADLRALTKNPALKKSSASEASKQDTGTDYNDQFSGGGGLPRAGAGSIQGSSFQGNTGLQKATCGTLQPLLSFQCLLLKLAQSIQKIWQIWGGSRLRILCHSDALRSVREDPFGLTRSAFGHCPNRI